MICLQRGCALSASLQYPRGTQVCNMKNTDANKQHSSHKQRLRIKASIFLTFNHVHKISLLHHTKNYTYRHAIFLFAAWMLLNHQSLQLYKQLWQPLFFESLSQFPLVNERSPFTLISFKLCTQLLPWCSASSFKDFTHSYFYVSSGFKNSNMRKSYLCTFQSNPLIELFWQGSPSCKTKKKSLHIKSSDRFNKDVQMEGRTEDLLIKIIIIKKRGHLGGRKRKRVFTGMGTTSLEWHDKDV